MACASVSLLAGGRGLKYFISKQSRQDNGWETGQTRDLIIVAVESSGNVRPSTYFSLLIPNWHPVMGCLTVLESLGGLEREPISGNICPVPVMQRWHRPTFVNGISSRGELQSVSR